LRLAVEQDPGSPGTVVHNTAEVVKGIFRGVFPLDLDLVFGKDCTRSIMPMILISLPLSDFSGFLPIFRHYKPLILRNMKL